MKGGILVSEVVAARHAAGLEAAAPGVPRVVFGREGAAGDVRRAEVAFLSGDLDRPLRRAFARELAKAEALAWLHTSTAGVNSRFFQGLLERGVRLTTSSGAHAVAVAQSAMLSLLALSRDLSGWLEAQARRAWEPHEVRDLAGSVLGVVGLGPIGLEVARLGAAFRMRVIGLRRRPRGDEPCETWPLERLPALLALADHLVLALPLAPATHHLIDAQALASLKPGAVLVNVARGALVDEAALAEALRTRRLAGAALDAFEREPLPASSPLWELPNLILTPHSSARSAAARELAAAIFLDNLARYRRGAPLRNEVSLPSAAGAEGNRR